MRDFYVLDLQGEISKGGLDRIKKECYFLICIIPSLVTKTRDLYVVS